ncbi:MAG TPA: hypothetical protein VMA95_12525 [Streptosporangiaceae bacterium]|nr:hypothetical protein [Streptosporangiaceae bacterium]
MGEHDDSDQAELEATLARIARETGGTLRRYPRQGNPVRRVVLRDLRDERGSQFEAAQLEDDGTLRITGHDQGASVSDVFGDGISSYEWVYVVPPGRIGSLIRQLGGNEDDDVLSLLAAWHARTNGIISNVLKHPEVAAEFSNWHS